jgi:hypothetical protein
LRVVALNDSGSAMVRVHSVLKAQGEVPYPGTRTGLHSSKDLSPCPRRESNPDLRFRKPNIVRGEMAKIIAVCVLCVLFASLCHKGPHGRSTKSNIVVVQDTQSGSDTSSLTDMDGAGISARRLEPNLNGIERKRSVRLRFQNRSDAGEPTFDDRETSDQAS